MTIFNRDKVKEVLKPLIVSTYEAHNNYHNIYKNTLDCYSAIIDASIRGISLKDWMELEKQRQIQKSMQNKIGYLHQEILGTLEGVRNLDEDKKSGTRKEGTVVDIICDSKKIVAEVRNKWNTTKGTSKKNEYDALVKGLDENKGYTAYLVCILPKNGKIFDKVYVPSDNTDKSVRKSREDVRIIDGKSFYKILTGSDNAMAELYSLITELTIEILEESCGVFNREISIKNDDFYSKIFEKVYP